MNFLGGANWKVAVSGVGTALFSALTALAALPYELGGLATIISPDWKSKIFTAGLVSTVALRVWNATAQKSKEVTGGSVSQTLSGAAAAPGTQTLVDITTETSKLSGEKTP